jgi:hypothetical protein
MVPNDIWPWIALAALGLFHGLNPAMGWLFAVALGLQRGSERVVLLSLAPIAIGHAAAVAAVLIGFLALGFLVDRVTLSRVAAAVLIGWAIWHLIRGHRQPLVVGMQTGLAGLAVWSFLMASAHGAGLMLIPVLLPICAGASPTQELTAGAIPISLAALGLHSAVMLATIAAMSVAVYKWLGVDFLRRGWINLDWVWVGALFACGVLVLVT